MLLDKDHFLPTGLDHYGCVFCGTPIYECKKGGSTFHHIYLDYPCIDNPNSENHITDIGQWCLTPFGHCDCVGYDPETLLNDDNSVVHPQHPKLNYRITI
tara:strand:+ start:393 stop:692 length:300 start_codon:yes stop_codon:yes gene_type:complete